MAELGRLKTAPHLWTGKRQQRAANQGIAQLGSQTLPAGSWYEAPNSENWRGRQTKHAGRCSPQQWGNGRNRFMAASLPETKIQPGGSGSTNSPSTAPLDPECRAYRKSPAQFVRWCDATLTCDTWRRQDVDPTPFGRTRDSSAGQVFTQSRASRSGFHGLRTHQTACVPRPS